MIMIGGGLLIFGITTLILIPRTLPVTPQTGVGKSAPAKVDYPAPEIELQDISGHEISLADYRGQVVLVNN